MKLRYQNNVEDLVAFNRYVLERTPLLRQQAWLMAVLAVVLAFMVMVVINYAEPDPWDFDVVPETPVRLPLVLLVALAAAAGAGAFFLWKPLLLYNNARILRKLLRHNPDKVVLAERELEIADGQLIERNDYGEFRWHLAAIEKVAVTPEHVFVRMSSLRAYILPREAVDEAKLEIFLDELAYARRQPPPTDKAPPRARGSERADAIQVRDERPPR